MEESLELRRTENSCLIAKWGKAVVGPEVGRVIKATLRGFRFVLFSKVFFLRQTIAMENGSVVVWGYGWGELDYKNNRGVFIKIGSVLG